MLRKNVQILQALEEFLEMPKVIDEKLILPTKILDFISKNSY